MDGASIAAMVGSIVAAVSAVAVAYITHGSTKIQNENANEILGDINEVHQQVEGLKEQNRAIEAQLASNNRLTVANSRGLIAQVYDNNRTRKAIDESVFQNVIDLYDAYKSTTVDGHVPNSWCDQMVAEMRGWRKL